MKYLPFPAVDDATTTRNLSQNDRLHKSSYPHLRAKLGDILDCYQCYFDMSGNALDIAPLALGDPLKKGLGKNYSSPPKSLSYIAEIRRSSRLVCPMCGSLKPYTVDHFLPKDDYSEFSIYSRNLVPACDCNSKRGKKVADIPSGVRALHPYFDDCLSERLLTCSILPAPSFPRVVIRITQVNPAHLLAGCINFHAETVVRPSGLEGWLLMQWATAVDCPYAVIQTLPRSNVAGFGEMKLILEDALGRNDRSLGTPNNWQSIFIHGLLMSPDSAEWLRNKHNSEFP